VKLFFSTAEVGEYLYRIMPEHMTVMKFREGAIKSLLYYREGSSITVCKYPKDQREVSEEGDRVGGCTSDRSLCSPE
jgi:hypothetical protein